MLCNLTGGSCGFYDMNETRRLVSLNFYIQVFYKRNLIKSFLKKKNQAIGCENTDLTITCPVYTKIIIILAIYGRTDSTICTQNAEALAAVVRHGTSIFVKTDCIRDVTSNVQIVCGVNSNSCTIQATNSVFGDPCVLTYKYLRVEYACVQLNSGTV